MGGRLEMDRCASSTAVSHERANQSCRKQLQKLRFNSDFTFQQGTPGLLHANQMQQELPSVLYGSGSRKRHGAASEQ